MGDLIISGPFIIRCPKIYGPLINCGFTIHKGSLSIVGRPILVWPILFGDPYLKEPLYIGSSNYYRALIYGRPFNIGSTNNWPDQ